MPSDGSLTNIRLTADINLGTDRVIIGSGKNIPTSQAEEVQVKMKEVDGEDSITLLPQVEGK